MVMVPQPGGKCQLTLNSALAWPEIWTLESVDPWEPTLNQIGFLSCSTIRILISELQTKRWVHKEFGTQDR